MPETTISVNGGPEVPISTVKKVLKQIKDNKTHPETVSGTRLKSFIERIERLEEEKKALSEDIRDVYAEAKGTGFEPRIIRKIVSLKKQSPDKRREDAELLELYASSAQLTLF